ncbi:ClbS/DfsB family four-helix bundle protein [Gymnodinialimonas sp. 2305UL16-5]|uniref:ClbS/DfsB family four-helix bundle protein n=1 Tax=Gymnodinialimonas mytili TaxID=3126503 RepID=UPI0030AD6532
MPAATTKHDLLTATDKEWHKLQDLLDRVPDRLAMLPHEDDGPSIRDIVTHRAHWTQLFFQWLDEGEAAQMPDHGVKWNALKPYNAALRARYSEMNWKTARAWLDETHGRLRNWIEGTDEHVLYGEPMPGGNGWTRGRYAEASGPSHYRSAAKYVRSVLKAVDAK